MDVDKDDLRIAQDIELVDSDFEIAEEPDLHENNVDSAERPKPADHTFDDDTFSGDDTLSGDLTLSDGDEVVSGGAPASERTLDAKKAADDSDFDRLIGKVVGGHYLILCRVGAGGMSRVYRAKHLLLNKEVALKFLAVGRQFDSKAIARFQKEATAASELQHPSICTTREFGVDEDGIPFLVMDYVEGRSLSDLLWIEETLDPPQALDIMIGICRGLEHAHAQGVIHRDIKPANVILTRDRAGLDAVKLVDFGIAKLIRDDESGPDLTQTGEVFGTPKYMSPEQCLGKPVDQRADIYSLGCIFYEMFAGKAPFCNESALQILFSHINDQPQSILEKCGRNVQAIIDRCLQKDPAQRYQRVSDLLTDLEAVKGGKSLVFAQYKRSVDAKILISSIVLATAIALCAFAISALHSTHEENLKDAAMWEAAHNKAVEFRTSNKIIAAEAALEESLAIAKNSRNESLVALTLQELSDVETALGKTHEAAEHKKALSNKIKLHGISHSFLMVAFALIGVGSALLAMAYLVLGKDQRTLEEFLKNKRLSG